ncbi:FAD-dependent oxidoreductase [Microbacterium terrae]|nr:FAD-dependent oxidoreductase [Microbacterium terrae]GLJ97188.1 putative ferredoxin/ferredoxin--NADP reductase [Microbacterium terrae]
MYIDPTVCIDCGACADACPVDAIVHESAPAADHHTGVNSEYFTERPIRDPRPSPIPRRNPRRHGGLRVAVIGAGPAGLYATEELSALPGVEVNVFERLPTPYGLVRAGVAPDHPQTKRIAHTFARLLRRRNVHCWFNTEVGKHIALAELLQTHNAVLVTSGASQDRRLSVPGEDLPGSHGAHEFVAWCNGHPDFADRRFDLQGRRAVVIGDGNVALDVARVLARPVEAFHGTDMADDALDALRTRRFEEKSVVGRRGPDAAAYGTAELASIAQLDGVSLLAHAAEVGADHSRRSEDRSSRTMADRARRAQIVADATKREPLGTRITLRFGLTPTVISGSEHVDGVLFARADGSTEHIDASLVIRAIGFRGTPIAGLPFDGASGTIPQRDGRVLRGSPGRWLVGVYCAGWIKRGPSGVIGTNRIDASETISAILEDHSSSRLPSPRAHQSELADLVRRRNPDLVTLEGWMRIEEKEARNGARHPAFHWSR